MPDSWQPPSNGALDDSPWPEQLIGRACATDAADDRLFGYAVLGDVARNYSFSDLVYLGIVGELPDQACSQRFHAAMCAAGPMSVAEAPAHAGVLARISGSSFASSLATGMLIAADRAREIVALHSDVLTQPAQFYGDTDAEWVANLSHVAGFAIDPKLSRHAAVISLLHAAGLTGSEQMEAALVAAQIVGVTAETLRTGPQDLPQYPVKLPQYRYVEGRDSAEVDEGSDVVRRK